MSLNERLDRARSVLDACGQTHVLHFYKDLDESGRRQLLGQIESVDWPESARLIETHVKSRPKFDLPHRIEPAPWYPAQVDEDLKTKYDLALAMGEKLIRDEKVAAFTVAGGQGTRLGWDGPKGTLPATSIRKLTLFGCFAEYILKTQEKYQSTVPWYIMTSPANDVDIRDAFVRNDYFGLASNDVRFFAQAMMPSFELESGRALLAARDRLALSPNGHGGSLKALYTSGATQDMRQRGIEQISYTQVDNPLVRVVDPLFVGLHAHDGAQMSSKFVTKATPKEKVGNFCLAGGRVTVIEYSDFPDKLAQQRLDDGQLRFRAGSIAVHIIRVDFVESLNRAPSGDVGQSEAGFRLPFHRAEKKVPYIDLTTGECIKPTHPNAVKLEMFVFDALPMCDASIIYETDRIEEFAPIKNADVEPVDESVDSPWTSRQIQTERAARWLEGKGVVVPRRPDGKVDADIEISHRSAIHPDDLDEMSLPSEIESGSAVLL